MKGELLFGQRLQQSFAPGLLRAQLVRDGRPTGGNDLLIAAIALRADATLVAQSEVR